MKLAKKRLSEVSIYGRRVSELLLPDQMEFIERYAEDYSKEILGKLLSDLNGFQTMPFLTGEMKMGLAIAIEQAGRYIKTEPTP